jgi:GNAT superfamily N-acetyltransferase
MLQLADDHLGRVVPLFDRDMPNSPMIFSTLDGRTPGRAYVDDIDDPTACVVGLDFLNLAFLGGHIEQEWLHKAVARLWEERAILLSWSPQTAKHLEPPFPVTEVVARYEFFDRLPGQSALPVPVPVGTHLRRVDEALLGRCLWRDLITSAYGTQDRFLQHGMGLCLMSRHEICSEAYAVFFGGGRVEIGAITQEKYRRRGYAHVTCQHLIRLCEARGFATYWSCEQDNVASMATARKLGYQVQRAYQWLYYAQNAQG